MNRSDVTRTASRACWLAGCFKRQVWFLSTVTAEIQPWPDCPHWPGRHRRLHARRHWERRQRLLV